MFSNSIMLSITCVIPVYNVETYILDCLKSIASQIFLGRIECLIIDDCGTDKSIQIAEDFILNYEGNCQFRIIKHEFNRGLSAARNTGIVNATGDYILFVDSDDKLTPDSLSLLSAPLKNDLYDVVVGNFIVQPVQDYHTKLRIPDNMLLRGSEVIKEYGSFNIYMMAWNKLCKRSFLLDMKCFFYEGILHEDELWSYMLSVYADTMFIVNKVTYIYNIRGGSIMNSSKLNKRKNDLFVIFREMIKIAGENKLIYNYYSNNCIQNIIYKQISLCENEKEGFILYEKIKAKLGVRRFASLFANSYRFKAQILDFHWFLPLKYGFKLYKKLKYINF